MKSNIFIYFITIASIAFLTAIWCWVGGIYGSFIPNVTWVQSTQNVSLVLSTILTVLAYRSFFRKDSKFREDLKHRQKTWVTTLILPFVTFLLPYMGIRDGLPSILHKFVSSNDGYELFVVESKTDHDPYVRWRCTGRVMIDTHLFLNDRVCGVPRDMWEEASNGDTLKLIGTKSIFGLSYHKLSLIKGN